MSRNGKVKMQLVKFQISANCITYSITGKAPFDDVVGVVMLVLNPEMQSPMHVHCYRCDSAETAQIMHANIQFPDRARQPNMPRRVVDELKHKFHVEPRNRNTNSLTRYDSDLRGSLSDIPLEMKSKYRMFGDTILRDTAKSRSLDNLAEPIVSTNIRGNDNIPSPRRFPRSELTDPFGQSYERMNTLEGFWKSKIRRTSSIKMDF
ncbi:hypothetical protein WR25_16959 [Diploscapter pachys]|uniref:PID domain-containing protein n=1 Tax=Diploscapter pachys TaxID=2018661 RepID=A0A2A2KQP9_9BILA|nr:hypothetical protein WR25_16959 [Diploscapter pachys]